MPEYSTISDYFLIINNGRSVIVGTPDELRNGIAGQLVLQVMLKRLNQKIIESVKQVKQVKDIVVDSSASKLTIMLDNVELGTPEVVRNIVTAGGDVLTVNVLRPSLEEAYLKALGRNQTEDS